MRKFSLLGALVAVVAFGVVAAARASANVWLKGGAAIAETNAATSHGTLEFHYIVLGIEVKILCSRLLVGTVGIAGKDLASEVQNLSGTEKNLVVCESHTTSLCGGKVILHLENLPWSTQLLESVPIGDFFSEDAKGEPAWLMLCETGSPKEVLCKKNMTSHLLRNGANGSIFEYAKAGTLTTTCSNGDEGWVTGTEEVLNFTAS